jgi:hypothetical protein
MGRAPAKKQLSLSALSDGMPAITPAHGQMLAEAAAVCLELKTHQPGVGFARAGLMTEDLHLLWEAATEQARLCYADKPDATEWGAAAIAILFVREITGKVVVERSAKGTGFDYWLGDGDSDLIFQGLSRLEVSGILVGTQAQIAARIAQKKKQMDPSDDHGPGLVAVIEFGTPVAHVESK